MPLDDKTANALADYFSSPAGATALEEEPAPAEGGQGEVGTPIAPKGPMISDDQARALADQIDQQKPGLDVSTVVGLAGGPAGPALQWLTENVPLFRTMTKAEATGYLDEAQGVPVAVKTLNDFYRNTLETPSNDFVGKPLDEVRARRDQLQAQRDELETNFNDAMKRGTMGGLQVTGASAEINGFQQKIDEANQVLQSGQIKTKPTEDTGPLAFLSDRLSGALKVVPAAESQLQQALPTPQALDQSIPGIIASGIGTMGAQLPFMMADMGPVGFALGREGQVFDDAKKAGASDETAEVAALIDSLGSAAMFSTMELPVSRLANLLKGQPAVKSILDLGAGIATGSVGMGGLQFYQNAIARLTGYDPDRPLDEGVLQQALFGAGVSALTESAAKVPELLRYARPAQLEVREKPGAPATETPQVQPAPVTPLPTPPTEPLAEAAAAVRATQGVAPEQVLEAQGSPEEQFAKSHAELDQALAGLEGEPVTPAPPPVAPTAPETAVAPPTAVAAYEPPTPYQRFEPPARPGPDASPEELARWNTWNAMVGPDQAALQGARIDSTPVTEFNARAERLAEVYRAQGVGAAPPPAGEAAAAVAVPPEVQAYGPEAVQRFLQMAPEDRARYLAHGENIRQAYSASNIRGEAVPPPLPETGVSVTPDQVKATTNQAASAMGMDQRVHYVASVDDLPGRVRRAMSQEQLGGTAQTVYDKGMGELWVIGDRFDGTSQHELNRTLIHDILPRVYGSLSDLRIENNPADTRLGHYDILSDRPVLNEASLLRTTNPFEAASKTALEEIVAHQGITRLLGSREADAYRGAMRNVRQRFDTLRLSDTLAREKGFRDLDDMAKAYGFEDYAKNPRHNNALTEELWAAYAQRYGTLQRLQEQAPQWWQQAVNTLSQGLRRRLGLGISDLDVQNLVADSFGALRRPKWGDASQFHPEVAGQAKNDMAAYQLAALRGPEGAGGRPDPEAARRELERRLAAGEINPEAFQEALARLAPEQTSMFSEFDKEQQRRIAEETAAGREPPPLPVEPPGSAEALAEAAAERQAAGEPGMANIGDLFVAGQRTETRAGLSPGEAIRAQPFKLSTQQDRPFSERMALADRATSVYDTRTLQGVLNDARQIFQRDFGNDVYRAMDDLRRSPVNDAHPAMRYVINEATNAQIADLRARGLTDAARSLELTRDRFNRQMAEVVTNVAQALNAQKLMYETGDTAIGRLQAGLIKAQERGVGRGPGVQESLRRINQIGQDAAGRLGESFQKRIDSIQARLDRLRDNPQSLATRYINAMAATINERMSRLGFTDLERPILQELFNRFQQRVSDALRDPAAEIPTTEAAKRMSTTDSIRETLANFPMFQRAWDETVTRLKTDNPNSLFFQKVDNALAEPFGAQGVRQVVRESGNDLRDLIFRHYSTQERVGNELAQSLTERLGLPQDQALRIQQLFDNHYRSILRTTAAGELEQALKRLGNPAKRADGELNRLTDLMAIGGLDKQEYYNLLAKRFGLGAWDPASIARMKELGGMLQRLRDEGGPEVYKNQIAAQLSDVIAQSKPWQEKNISRLEGLWMASLLTGPFTHGSYYLQNTAQVMTNLALRSLFRPGVTLADLTRSFGDLFNGMIHSARTELPFILRTGIHTQREVPGSETYGGRVEAVPYPRPLEALPLPKIAGLENPLNWYRYVGRFLHGMETVFYRGASNAITRTLAMRLADERGMGSEEAQRWAEQMVYGTENDRQEAIQQAREEQAKFKFTDQMRDMRVQELIDQKRLSRAPELADESHRFALHSIYREAPYGALGMIARRVNNVKGVVPGAALVVPFVNLPANVANEFMNWTPIGIWRGRDALPGMGGTAGIEKLYKETGFEKQIEAGRISDRELRDLSYEYLAKGALGTMAMTVLGIQTIANGNNPNPAMVINGAGPSDPAHRDALRAAGWLPYSIKIGDHYFDYQATPWKSMLGVVGGIADHIRYDKADPQNYVGDLLQLGMMDMFGAMTDASFLQGAQTLMAIGAGANTPENQRKFSRFISQTAATAAMVPFGGTGTKQIYRLFDPRQFDAKDIPSLIARNIPVVNSAFLQPHLNVLGEPVTSTPLTRLVPSAETSDQVWRFIDEHNLKLTYPNASRKLDGVQMSPAELHDFTQVRGQYLKAELAEAINSAEFRALGPDEMNDYVKELEKNADEVGKYQIQQHRAH